ncbi:MAG TPA: hypothetical protein VMD76_00205 [Candidatus Sulfotelmatobacter sp.]|nr:hypothetical protein [Candidatus Sulfotelmatobacter sp.]
MPNELNTDGPGNASPDIQQQNEIDVENAKGDDLRKQDLLFNSAGGTTDACLDLGVSREFLYREGYLKAARVLANHALANEYDRNILLFPVAFLYRHHIELSLKDLIQTARTVASDQPKNPEGHLLAPLWEELKDVLRRLDESPGRNDLDAVEAYVKQVEQVDKQGQAFRYATSVRGEPHLREFDILDVRAFSEAMERLAGYLGGLSSRLDLLLDHKEEIMGHKEEFEENS